MVERNSLMNVGWPGNGESEKTAVQAHATDLKTPGGKLPMPLALDVCAGRKTHRPSWPTEKQTAKPRQHETDGARQNGVSCHHSEPAPYTLSARGLCSAGDTEPQTRAQQTRTFQPQS